MARRWGFMTRKNFGMTLTMKKLTNTTKKNSTFQQGDIVIANVRYVESNKQKPRPVLVISSSQHNLKRKDLIILKISSTEVRNKEWEAMIPEGVKTGLKKASKVIFDHVTVVSKDLVEPIGRIDDETLEEVKDKLKLLFGI